MDFSINSNGFKLSKQQRQGEIKLISNVADNFHCLVVEDIMSRCISEACLGSVGDRTLGLGNLKDSIIILRFSNSYAPTVYTESLGNKSFHRST
jgi:hypothetical protein